jgi:hypothetical protein
MRGLKIEKFDLQVLNLANNDLGDISCAHLRHLMDGLVSLNLSNTKLGSKGCMELAKNIRLPCKETPLKSRLQILDLSYNDIGRQAFNQLLHRLRSNDSLT